LGVLTACAESGKIVLKHGKVNLLGDKGTTTIILEAVASHNLWIWHAFFGCPGTLNDINVLNRSPVFDDVEREKAPSVNLFVNQRPYNMAYFMQNPIFFHAEPYFFFHTF
jgi:hypothetical protein